MKKKKKIRELKEENSRLRMELAQYYNMTLQFKFSKGVVTAYTLDSVTGMCSLRKFVSLSNTEFDNESNIKRVDVKVISGVTVLPGGKR